MNGPENVPAAAIAQSVGGDQAQPAGTAGAHRPLGPQNADAMDSSAAAGALVENNPATTRAELSPLEAMQQRFALINIAGKIWVLDRDKLAARTAGGTAEKLVVSNRSDGKLLLQRALKARFPKTKADDVIADFLIDPNTTCYSDIEFNPLATDGDRLNLWIGPTVVPQKGTWARIELFLREVICNGDGQCYEYLIRFLAHALQRPEEKPGILVIMLGGQGTGKGTLGRILRLIWSATYLQVHDVSTVTGSFNAALERVYIVFMDEALFVGDRRASDGLKSLITEPVIHINEKHQPARQMLSYHRYFAATNADHFKNTERDDRRDFVLRVSEKYKGDHAYWTAVHDEIANGGVAAMVYDLQELDLSGFNVRNKPNTAELVEQKLQSLDPIARWWHDALTRGGLSTTDSPIDDSWPEFIPTDDAIKQIVEFSGGKLYKKPAAIDVVRALTRLCPSATKGQKTTNFHRKRGLVLPTLERARIDFEAYIGGKLQWDSDMDDDSVPEFLGTDVVARAEDGNGPEAGAGDMK